MKTFIQLKDEIGFAFVNTVGNTEGIEVSFGTGENYLGQLYSNGQWSVAPTIEYAIINEDGNIIELRKTKFPSELGPWPEWNSEIPTTWNWIDGSWVDPNPIIEVTPIEEI
jgi:acyl-coenzyme A synthetase/AMP-(fatty) acid ligase